MIPSCSLYVYYIPSNHPVAPECYHEIVLFISGSSLREKEKDNTIPESLRRYFTCHNVFIEINI